MSEVSVRTEDPELAQPTAQHIAGVSLLEIAPGGVFAATVGDDGTLPIVSTGPKVSAGAPTQQPRLGKLKQSTEPQPSAASL